MILDTNALSAIADGEPAAVEEATQAATIAIPVIVVGEYLFGVAQSRHRKEYERWLAEMLSASVVLDVTAETAPHYAELRTELKRAGTPVPSNDLWIAALARQHRLPILTRDGHFDLIKGLRRRGW